VSNYIQFCPKRAKMGKVSFGSFAAFKPLQNANLAIHPPRKLRFYADSDYFLLLHNTLKINAFSYRWTYGTGLARHIS
jgi:hypothetical protein